MRLPALLVIIALAAGLLMAAGADVPFQHVIIDPTIVPNGHKPKVIGDFAGHGQADIAVVTAGKGMFLYRYPAWTKRLISPDGSDGEDAQAGDVDGDGDLDIVVGGLDGHLFWLENPARQGKDPYNSVWKTHDIRNINSHDVVLGDSNKDGKLDIATNSGLLLQKTPDSWTLVAAPQIDRGAEGTALADLTGDDSLDLIAPSPNKPYQLVWFENPRHAGGDSARDVWKRHVIGPGYEQMSIAAADLNHDGRLDVVMAPMYQTGGLVWFEAPADPRRGAWKEHRIDPSVQFVHQGSLQVADFNGDGNPDIAFAEQEQSRTKRVGIFFSLRRDGLSWNRQILAATGGHNIKAGRVGRDRLPSILNANHGYFGAPNPVELWRNRRR